MINTRTLMWISVALAFLLANSCTSRTEAKDSTPNPFYGEVTDEMMTWVTKEEGVLIEKYGNSLIDEIKSKYSPKWIAKKYKVDWDLALPEKVVNEVEIEADNTLPPDERMVVWRRNGYLISTVDGKLVPKKKILLELYIRMLKEQCETVAKAPPRSSIAIFSMG